MLYTYLYNLTAWVSALLVLVGIGNAKTMSDGTGNKDSPAFFDFKSVMLNI